jgi:glycosyltransferase involved in cell wall biosynthesis
LRQQLAAHADAVHARRRQRRDKWALLKDADDGPVLGLESFGLAVVESLAAGVPVIATRMTPGRKSGGKRAGFRLTA